MLGPDDIKKLQLPEQATHISTNGCYLHFRVQGWCKIDLYWMGSYYAEIWFLYDLKTVALVRILNEKPPLEPYLETIQLNINS
ncbi:MAG: hypothetical protein LPK19_11365 [Hymenobacteraceae bacterium]|mgnify:CR=1 FL=1|nr:hypothetical protein [Hymenobacteraceae bacterium]MDX5396824.1 hypothetical protein [Hymenobacteraceae bacterium]MDX5512895.1 hypothetical protein [Hymenobacteraceae bacterium]